MNFYFKKEEEKLKVGRPKLADTKQKKNALILSVSSIMVAICLVFGGLFDLNIINTDKLKGSIFGTTITGSKVYKGVLISVPKKVLLGDPEGSEQYKGATIYDKNNFNVTINNTTDKEMTDVTYSLSGTGDLTGADGGTTNIQSNGFPASVAANTKVETKFYGGVKDAYDYKDVQEQLIISYKVDGESFNEIYDINFYHAIYGNDYLKSLPLVDSEESTGEYAYSGNESETFYYKSNRSKVFMDKREDLYDMNVNFSYKTIFSNIVIILAPQAARSVAMSASGDAKLSDYINFGSSDNGHTYKVKSATDYETFDNPSHRLWGSVKQTTNGTVPIKLPVYAEYSKKKWTGSYEYQYATSDTTKFTRTKDVTIDLTIYDKSILEKKLVEASAKIDKYDDDYYKVDTYNNYINAAKEVYKTRNTTQAKIDEAIKNLDTVINATPEEKEADYTKYNEIISKIVSLDSEFYKDNEEYKKLIEEYNNRNNYNNFKKSNQSTLDTYVSTLTSIYNNIPGNYTEVDFAIDRANKISNEIEVAGVKYNRYTDESYKALTDAVANVVTGKKVKDQSEIDSYAENINNAIKNLKDHAADYTEVDKKIKSVPKNEIEVDGIKYKRYTDESYKVLTDLISSIEESKKTKTVLDQEEVNGYVNNIENAINGLKDHAADYAKVDEAINAVPKNEIEVSGVKYKRYTEDSYKKVTDLVASVVRDKKVTEQAAVNKYATDIKNAINGLKDHAAYYTKVDEKIKSVPKNEIEVSGTKYKRYTDESYKVLTDLITKIQNEEKNSPKTVLEQEKVNKYITEIDNAINGLKDHAADYTKVDEAINKAKEKLGDKLVNEIEIDGVKYERYTSDSYKTVIDAINSVVKGKLVTEQEIVNKYAADINNTVKNLKDHAADYTKVDEAISAVPKNEIEVSGVKYKRYTEGSYKKVTDLVASVVRDKKVTEQAAVNKYATDIKNAINGLKDHAAYYTKVDEKIKSVPKNEIEVSGTKYKRYTDESYKVLTDLITKIQNEEKNSPKTVLEQEKVNKYITEIDNAINGLKDHAADYTKVDEAINKAKEKLGDKLVNEIEIDGVKYERYTSDSYKTVIDAINSVVKGKLVTEQEIVNKYAADINNAVKNLKDHAADYALVDEAISAVPKNEIEINEVKYQKYTTASYKELTDLIDNIDRNKTILEQEEVNNYITLISKKEKELGLCKADYSKLKNITSLIPYDFSIYNLESVEKLNTLLDKIKNLDSELKITSQDKLDSLIKEIDEVLSSLKLKDTSVTTKYDNKYDANYKPDKKVIKKNNKVSKSHIVSITVNGKELDLNSASITVENDVSKADIKVELSNSSDKYEIYGGNILIVGDNTITVYVYNDSDSYEYKFNIKREDEELTSVKKKTKTTINNIIKYKTNSKLIISASILGVLIIGTVCYLIIKKKNSEK